MANRYVLWATLAAAIGLVACFALRGYLFAVDVPPELKREADRLLLARLHGECQMGWGFASKRFKAERAEEQFCREFGRGCAQGTMELESVSHQNGQYLLAGAIQCEGGVRTQVTARWVREGNTWRFDTYDEGI